MRQLVWLAVAAILGFTGCAPVTFTIGGSPEDNRVRATLVDKEPGMGSARIAVVDVAGVIMNADRPALFQKGENPVSLLQEKLEAARDDPDVKAVVLRLNTPGGTVTASEAMYREVLRFKKETGKPVVALMMDVAASGGYFVACAADGIVAYPTTVTGSIGVIFQTMSIKPALGRIGINAEAITSGPNKDVASPLSTLTDEHRAILRRLVDDFYGRFTAVVRENRPRIPADKFAMVTDGRVFSGSDALALGLVDQLGDIHDAVALAKSKAGVPRAGVILYHRRYDYVGSVYARGPAPAAPIGTQVNLMQLNLGDALAEEASGFYYLWKPELGPAGP